MDRATIASAVPADRAELRSDRPLLDAIESLGVEHYAELICNPASLKDFLEDEELAAPLAEMVVLLPKCIAELSEQMGRVKLPEYEALLRRVAQVERQLLAYAMGAV